MGGWVGEDIGTLDTNNTSFTHKIPIIIPRIESVKILQPISIETHPFKKDV